MLDPLRFVATAVAKKDYVPELTHYRIKSGRVTGYNGMFALSSPIDIDLDVRPKAQPLLAAVAACEDVITLYTTATGRLAIKSGKFRAYIECLPDEPAHTVLPEGEEVELGPLFMEGIHQVAPIMGIDASRPWAMGIKLQNQSMFATNNVIMVEYWHGVQIPIDVVIPAQAVNELLRINEDPIKVQVTENSISFWFADNRWLRTQLIDPEGWPLNKIEALFGYRGEHFFPVDEGFEKALTTLKPFIDEYGSIFMTADNLSTSIEENDGASVDIPIPNVTQKQSYNYKNVVLLCEVADRIDWSSYPAPCPFYKGDRLRGIIVGRRV